MNVGIAGMPGSGKSTVFRAVTGIDACAESGPRGKPFPGIIEPPDPRLEKLKDYYKPKKTTPLRLDVLDIPGPGPGATDRESTSLPPKFTADMRNMDVLCAVIRGFGTPEGRSRDLAGMMRSFREELILSDLEVVDGKFERLAKGEKESFHGEKEIIGRIKTALESNEEVRSMGLPDETLKLLSGFAFLSLKPRIYVLNLSEDRKPGGADMESAAAEGTKQDAGTVSLFGKLEVDLLELSEDERREFLEDAGLEESGVQALLGEIFRSLDLIVFYTAVGDELRAWGVPAGTPVVKAAGKIHTDMEKGFIKAEVMHFEDFEELGSESACRREGRLGQEGKGYIVQDGDILTIKFNV